LSALATIPVTLLLCFGVFEPEWIFILTVGIYVFSSAVGKSRLYSLELASA